MKDIVIKNGPAKGVYRWNEWCRCYLDNGGSCGVYGAIMIDGGWRPAWFAPDYDQPDIDEELFFDVIEAIERAHSVFS